MTRSRSSSKRFNGRGAARRPSDRELQAYVDGELSSKRRMEVEAALQRDPALRHIAHRYEAQKRGVQRLYDDVLSEPVPHSLTDILKVPPKPRTRHH
jgi:anti-sigma factor RsiW